MALLCTVNNAGWAIYHFRMVKSYSTFNGTIASPFGSQKTHNSQGHTLQAHCTKTTTFLTCSQLDLGELLGFLRLFVVYRVPQLATKLC